MRNCLEALEREGCPRSAEALPLRPGAFQAGPDPFHDSFAFELSHGRQPMELQATGRSAGVDRFAEGHERDAETPELVEQHHQVLETATEAIEFPDDERIDLAALGIGHEAIVLGPAVLGSADAIDVFDGAPAARLNEIASLPGRHEAHERKALDTGGKTVSHRVYHLSTNSR